MKKNIKETILRCFCLSSAAFIFQACYGTPQDFSEDMLIRGKVVSSETKLPIPGIKVTLPAVSLSRLTDQDGFFYFYVPRCIEYMAEFTDVDGADNGQFADMKYLICSDSTDANNVQIEVELDCIK